MWEGSWGWPLHPHPLNPLPFSTFLLVLAPPSTQGWLGQPWGGNMPESRQTIFRLTAFTFGPTRASWKQTDKTKDSKLMTRAPCPEPNPWQLTPDLACPYPSSPPLLPGSPRSPDFSSPPNRAYTVTHIWTLTQWHTRTHTRITTTITLYLNSVTCGIWFRLSQEERDRDIQRESVSVSEWEKRPLCLCLDLHYHVLILMQFEKETDMETHLVKRDLCVLSGTACAHSPDVLPTHRSRARLHSLTKALFIHCHFTTRFQQVLNVQDKSLFLQRDIL